MFARLAGRVSSCGNTSLTELPAQPRRMALAPKMRHRLLAVYGQFRSAQEEERRDCAAARLELDRTSGSFSSPDRDGAQRPMDQDIQ